MSSGTSQIREDIPDESEGSDQWEDIREDVLARDDYECRFCGISDDEHQKEYKHGLHAHHIIPDAQGGPTSMENLITVCRSCHHTLESTHARAVAQLRSEDVEEGTAKAESDGVDWYAVASIRSSERRQKVLEGLQEEPKYAKEIADSLDTSMKRVVKQIRWLKGNGLAECLTPDRPHHRIYALTEQGETIADEV
jgi:hypothetical protein